MTLEQSKAAFANARAFGSSGTTPEKHYRAKQRPLPIRETPITVNVVGGCEVVNAISRDGQRAYRIESRRYKGRHYSRLRVSAANLEKAEVAA